MKDTSKINSTSILERILFYIDVCERCDSSTILINLSIKKNIFMAKTNYVIHQFIQVNLPNKIDVSINFETIT